MPLKKLTARLPFFSTAYPPSCKITTGRFKLPILLLISQKMSSDNSKNVEGSA